MASGQDLVNWAMGRVGTPYSTSGRFGPNFYDCSGLVVAGLRGIGDDPGGNQVSTTLQTGFTTPMSVDQAIKTPGALLFVWGTGAKGHVAISRGDGTVVEAGGTAHSVNVHSALNRGWTGAGMPIGLAAGQAAPQPATPGAAATPATDPGAEVMAQMNAVDQKVAERAAKTGQQAPTAENPTPDRPVAAGGPTAPPNVPTTTPGQQTTGAALGMLGAPIPTAGGTAAVPKGATPAGSFPAPVATTASVQPAPPPVVNQSAMQAASGAIGPTNDVGTHIAAAFDEIMGISSSSQERGPTPTKPPIGPATPHGSTVDEWITAALARTGKPESWREPLRRIIMRESSGNPTAVNNWDSNARAGNPSRGLMQLTTSNWNTYGGGGNWADPVDDIVGGIRYIDGRYGGDISKTLGRSY